MGNPSEMEVDMEKSANISYKQWMFQQPRFIEDRFQEHENMLGIWAMSIPRTGLEKLTTQILPT